MKKKGKIILGLATAAMVPAILTGCGHEHSSKEEWKSDETHHWHECTGEDCKENLEKEEHEATGTWLSTDTHHYKDCECGYDMNMEEHNFGEFETSSTHHWKSCAECGYQSTKVEHKYDKQVSTSEYFKEGTETTTTYFKSCECGHKGTDSFTIDKTEVKVSGNIYFIIDGQSTKFTLDQAIFGSTITGGEFTPSDIEIEFADKTAGSELKSIKFKNTQLNYRVTLDTNASVKLISGENYTLGQEIDLSSEDTRATFYYRLQTEAGKTYDVLEDSHFLTLSVYDHTGKELRDDKNYFVATGNVTYLVAFINSEEIGNMFTVTEHTNHDYNHLGECSKCDSKLEVITHDDDDDEIGTNCYYDLILQKGETKVYRFKLTTENQDGTGAVNTIYI